MIFYNFFVFVLCEAQEAGLDEIETCAIITFIINHPTANRAGIHKVKNHLSYEPCL